jgi:hypothetical protein
MRGTFLGILSRAIKLALVAFVVGPLSYSSAVWAITMPTIVTLAAILHSCKRKSSRRTGSQSVARTFIAAPPFPYAELCRDMDGKATEAWSPTSLKPMRTA